MSKVILFDLDGVLTVPEEMFSVKYARSHGHDLGPFTNFFESDWSEFVTGKKDLKQHVSDNPDFWQWNGSPDEFLKYWFESEDVRNEPLLEAVKGLRSQGKACYIATEQEKYRTEYIRTKMFKDEFDGVFSSAEIGYKKSDPRFFESIIKSLNIKPSEIIFIDDSQSKLAAAKVLGIQTHLYASVENAVLFIESNT